MERSKEVKQASKEFSGDIVDTYVVMCVNLYVVGGCVCMCQIPGCTTKA